MTRNRERRSFTVAAKSSGHQGFVSIPAKAPRVPQPATRRPQAPGPWAATAEAAPAAAPSADAEPRRILPNLNAWEAPAPEPEPDFVPEPSLPRVRRAASQVALDGAPRRRGRPRKVPLTAETPAPAVQTTEPAPVATARVEPAPTRPAPAPVPRQARPAGDTLRLGERWKRRLPRACW